MWPNRSKEKQNNLSVKNTFEKLLQFNHRTDIWWHKFAIVIWLLTGLYIIYLVLFWIAEKIGL